MDALEARVEKLEEKFIGFSERMLEITKYLMEDNAKLKKAVNDLQHQINTHQTAMYKHRQYHEAKDQ